MAKNRPFGRNHIKNISVKSQFLLNINYANTGRNQVAVMKILGIIGSTNSPLAHDGSAALIVDHKIVCAIEQERLSRTRYAMGQGASAAVEACLQQTGLRLSDIDHIPECGGPTDCPQTGRGAGSLCDPRRRANTGAGRFLPDQRWLIQASSGSKIKAKCKRF